jgi:hypothetical protein
MAYLQSEPNQLFELTQPEMLDISLWINREFAPRFSKPVAKNARALSFAAQELLNISAEISREFTPYAKDARSNLVLLPVDPRHLHAYWRIEEQPVHIQNIDKPDAQLTLRIYTQPQLPVESLIAPATPIWFDIRIDSAESNQDVALPAEAKVSGDFRAELGIMHGEQGFTPILVSNKVEMPKFGPTVVADHEKAVLSAAFSQFIIPLAPASSLPVGNHSDKD